MYIGGVDGPPSLPMATAEIGHDPCRLAAVIFPRACEAGDSGGQCVCFRDKTGSCILPGVGFDTTAAMMANGKAVNSHSLGMLAMHRLPQLSGANPACIFQLCETID